MPYNDLPPLPPRQDVETPAVFRKTTAAARAVAELKGLGDTIPNQAMLIDSLILQEAKASSEIENVLTTNDALFKAFTASSTHFDHATKEVLRYREALWKGHDRITKAKGRLNTDLFVELVRTIKQDDRGIRNRSGTYIGNEATGEVIYTPPYPEAVIREKLRDLEEFIRDRDQLDPLVKLALLHYQFESIHPFFDGNGRTGRIVNILYLVREGLLALPVLYLSKAIIDTKPEYYRLLRGVTENGAWEEWVLYILTAVETTASFTRHRILDIRALMEETMALAKEKLPPRVYSKELIELLFRQPYAKGQFLVGAGIAERKTAAEYLRELERIGVLKSQKVSRENLYLNVKLFDLLS